MRKIIPILIALVLIVGAGAYAARTMFFPVKHVNEIKEVSKEYGLDPVLVAAMASFTTQFEDKEYVANEANGVMGLSDETATKLAKELKMDNFNPKDQTDPKTSLKLGTYYMSKSKDSGTTGIVQEWNVRNIASDSYDRRAYAKEHFLPKIEKSVKIMKILYPELNK